MHIVIAGGTRFVGSALAHGLRTRGDGVTLLSRTPGAGRITWEEELPPCDAVINLCGEGILNRRWSPKFKQRIFDSRVETTRKLVEKIRRSTPQMFINASAVGYYPEEGKAPCSEESGPGAGFLAELCQAWESAALQAPVPTAIIRIAVVLGGGGGAFKRLHSVFKAGLGGKVGSGEQGFPWIHLEDLIALFLFILDGKGEGVFNGAAPDPVTNAEFTQLLGKKLGRPTFCTVPAGLLRMGLGEGAEALLKGAQVYPERALKEGFVFRYPSLTEALEELTHG